MLCGFKTTLASPRELPDLREATHRVTYTLELSPSQRDWWREWARPRPLSRVLREMVDDASGFAEGVMKPPPATAKGGATERACCERSRSLLGKTTCAVCRRRVHPLE